MKILGIDIGTTSISFAVFEDRECLASYTVKNNSALPGSDNIRQDADKILDIIETQLCDISREYPNIERLGLTGQMHGILYLDEAGRAVSPLYTWQDNSASEPYKDTTYTGFIERTVGRSIYGGYGLATHFYHRLNGMVPANASCLCTISDYAAMKLAGISRPYMHISNAASLGLYNLKSNSYDFEAISRLELNEALLPGIINQAKILGENNGRGVCVGLGDNQASFIGCVRDGQKEILLNVGTGSQISCMSGSIYQDSEIETRPLDGNQYLLVASALCGGRAYAMLERFFEEVLAMGGVKPRTLYMEMERAARNSRTAGLKTDTCFCGKRGEKQALGSIKNISEGNFTPGALVESFLRGIAEELLPAYTKYRALGDYKLLRASGNAVRNNGYFRELIEEIYQMPLELASAREEAAFGAALFAAGAE